MRPRLIPLGLVLLQGLLAVASPHAATARPLTFEDAVKMKELSSLRLSPDSTKLAFVAASRDLASNSSSAAVWVLDLASVRLSQVTAGGAHEYAPDWSPDGTHIAFVSDSGGESQVWVGGPDGVLPRRVTALVTGAGSPRWVGDGKSIVFTSSVFPECADNACNAARLDEEANRPVQARLIEKAMYRHWDSWKDGRYTHLLIVPAEGGEATDLTAGDVWGMGDTWDISPDGKWIVYTSKNPQFEERHTNTDLYLLRVTKPGDHREGPAFEPVPVTDNPAADASPVFSPDGSKIAYVAQQKPDFESDRWRLALLDISQLQFAVENGTTAPAPGQPIFPAESFDRWVHEHGWLPGGTGVWVAVGDQGRVAVYTQALPQGAGNGLTEPNEPPQKVLAGGFYTSIVMHKDRTSLLAITQSLTSAPEVMRARFSAPTHDILTQINAAAFEGIELAQVEDVWWSASDGRQVHGFILYPPGTGKDRKNPLLLVIHGGPQGMWEDRMHPRWNPQLLAAPGYVVLLPNPRGSTGYGQEFTDQVSHDWGGRAYDDLMRGVDSMVEKGIVDPERMCAAGGSYGGYMTNWILGHTDRFKCLITHAGVFDLRSKYGTTDELWFPEWEFGGPYWESDEYERWSPSNFVKEFKTPTLVIHGASDFRVCENQAMQLFSALQRLGIPSQFLYYPDETHFVVKPKNSQLWYATVHAWLKKWIGGGK